MSTADRSRPVRRTDLVVGAATAVASLGLLSALPALDAADIQDVGTVSLADPASPAWWVAVAVLLAQGVALVAARRAPRAVLVVVAALAVVLAPLTPSDLHGLSEIAVGVAVVLATIRMPVARLWPALVAAAVLVVAGEALGRPAGVAVGTQALLQAVGVVGLPFLVALLVRSRRELRRARDDEQTAVVGERDALVREQDALVATAVARERAAMARELHDIAAHHLSGIALMAGVIDRQIDTDPVRAHEAVRQVREQSTAVLDDLRRLVGLLRDDVPAQLSVESLAAVPDLVGRARVRGPVELAVRAEPGRPAWSGIGPLAQLAVYRTVQEALANAALHAPGAPSRVEVDDRDPERLTVLVTNEGAQAGTTPQRSDAGGHGLTGMRERAELVAATLRYGPTEDDGWAVRLSVPRERAETTPSRPRERAEPTPNRQEPTP